MQIKIGKRYWRRNGSVSGMLYPVGLGGLHFAQEEKRGHLYFRDRHLSQTGTHNFDLVREYNPLTAEDIVNDLLDSIDTEDDFFELFQWPRDEKRIARVREIMTWKMESDEQAQQERMEEMKENGE